MLRRDDRAGFYWRTHLLFFRRCYFTAPSLPLPVRIDSTLYQSITAWSPTQPAWIASEGRRRWWLFDGQFYWEDDGLQADDVLALVRDRERRQKRKLDRAHQLLALESDPRPHREPIPREVRRAVFERDGGRCVQCGSTFDLQYDHILPVALGGATTVENLQLLCADCNREKSDAP